MTGLDRSRTLWEATLVEGVDGDVAATPHGERFLTCLADGFDGVLALGGATASRG